MVLFHLFRNSFINKYWYLVNLASVISDNTSSAFTSLLLPDVNRFNCYDETSSKMSTAELTIFESSVNLLRWVRLLQS